MGVIYCKDARSSENGTLLKSAGGFQAFMAAAHSLISSAGFYMRACISQGQDRPAPTLFESCFGWSYSCAEKIILPRNRRRLLCRDLVGVCLPLLQRSSGSVPQLEARLEAYSPRSRPRRRRTRGALRLPLLAGSGAPRLRPPARSYPHPRRREPHPHWRSGPWWPRPPAQTRAR